MEKFCEPMKFTEETEYDYYYSPKADREHGHKMIDGKKYSEMIRAGRKPFLQKKYSDLVLVLTKKPFKDL